MFRVTSDDFAVAAGKGARGDEHVDERDCATLGTQSAIHPRGETGGSAVERKEGEEFSQTFDAPGFVNAVWPACNAPMELKQDVRRQVGRATIPGEALQVGFGPGTPTQRFHHYFGVDRRRGFRPRGPSGKPLWRSL
jgi:hypothetical protein